MSDEMQQTHPNCRCVMLPVVIDPTTGEAPCLNRREAAAWAATVVSRSSAQAVGDDA